MEAKLIVVGVLAFLAVAYYISQNDYISPDDSNPSSDIPTPVVDGFTHFQKTYNKKYASSIEKNYRLNVYYQNYLVIQENNSDKTSTYELGETQFMDLTQDEFINLYLMKNLANESRKFELTLPTDNLKGSADWRGKAVTRVKNQGQCGSCWAFSTVGALEGYSAVTKGKLQEFSEQQLVDCAGSDGAVCYGCSGGWPNQALGWVRNHGITFEESYAYKGVDQQCQKTSGEFLINGVVDVPQTGDQLKAAVEKQPVSVCIDASNWYLYKGGVFSNCGKSINHAVLLVAYDDSQWVIKNSWAESWGESGYIRLAAGNTCGIYSHGTYPL